MIWINLQEQQHDALTPIINLLKLSAADGWQMKDDKVLENCVYPNYAILGEGSRDLADMGDLLQQWVQMRVTDPIAVEEKEREKEKENV